MCSDARATAPAPRPRPDLASRATMIVRLLALVLLALATTLAAPWARIPAHAPPPPGAHHVHTCVHPAGVQNITFSATRYPHIRAHMLGALRRGRPRTLVVHRRGADGRRARLLARIA